MDNLKPITDEVARVIVGMTPIDILSRDNVFMIELILPEHLPPIRTKLNYRRMAGEVEQVRKSRWYNRTLRDIREWNERHQQEGGFDLMQLLSGHGDYRVYSTSIDLRMTISYIPQSARILKTTKNTSYCNAQNLLFKALHWNARGESRRRKR